MENIISIRNADIMGGENVVVYGLNMDIAQGDFVYIVGKVGTGKTSIIRTMIAETFPSKGSCKVCGYDIVGIKSRDIPFLRRKIGVVFQDFQLLMDRDVHANLAFVLEATGWDDPEKVNKRISDVLTAVGMKTKEHRMPHQLSGGEQQRIAIARAILNSPRLIIADEPTGNLDAETADGIMKLLLAINAKGTAVVMVTHSKDIFQRYGGRVFMCENETCTEIHPSAAKDLDINI